MRHCMCHTRHRKYDILYRINYIRYRIRYRMYISPLYDIAQIFNSSFIYRIRYHIRYRIQHPYTLSDYYSCMLSPGPAPQPSAAPSDAGDNPPWNSDAERDFQDQQYSPASPMSHYPGSLNLLVGFLSDIPDWY